MKSNINKNNYRNKHITLIEKSDEENNVCVYMYSEIDQIFFSKIKIVEEGFFIVNDMVHHLIGNVKDDSFNIKKEDDVKISDIANKMKNIHYLKRSLGYQLSKYTGKGMIKLIDKKHPYLIVELDENDDIVVSKECFCGCSGNMNIELIETSIEESTSREMNLIEINIKGKGIVLLKLDNFKQLIDEIELNENDILKIKSNEPPILRSSSVDIERIQIEDKYIMTFKGYGFIWTY